MIDWKSLPDGKEKRHLYYASREWALLKQAVRSRCAGICENCVRREMYTTHHMTYERLYQEDLIDLLGVCEGCHEWLSGKRAVNPVYHCYKVHPVVVVSLDQADDLYIERFNKNWTGMSFDKSKYVRLTEMGILPENDGILLQECTGVHDDTTSTLYVLCGFPVLGWEQFKV